MPGGGEASGLDQVSAAFCAEGSFLGAERHGSGHIHETWVARRTAQGEPVSLLLQRLNTGIFADPDGLMQNLRRVTLHLREKNAARKSPDARRRCLELLATRAGAALHRDPRGGVWRAFRFVEDTRSAETVEDPGQAFDAARAFGAFAADLADLPGPPLLDTIPRFHDLGRRVADFEAVVRDDPAGRGRDTRPEVEGLRRALEALEHELPAAQVAALPRRIAHHDCKLNNLLLDVRSGEALCVIDLDTVMHGTLLSDFGGLVRTATSRAPEDERDLARVDFDLELFEALSRGYAAGTAGLLDTAELRALPASGALLTLLDALRFLTDHLAGDVYFRVHRPGHNLDRARAQLRLAERMLERADEARRVFERAIAGG